MEESMIHQKNNIAFKVIVGSHNYHLQTKSSDEDYKVFYYPTFDDLYYGNKNSKSMMTKEQDIEFHDIRKLTLMLWKSNVNFLEVLFSQKIVLKDELYEVLKTKREEIARMNLPYLYNACIGMYEKKRKEFIRDKQSKKVYKHAMTMWRILDFLQRYEKNHFLNFQKSIWYESDDTNRQILLDIRNKRYQEVELENIITEKFHSIQLLSPIYKDQPLNYELKNWIDQTIKRYVKINVKEELYSQFISK